MHIEKITRLRESRTQAVFRKALVRGTALPLAEKEVSQFVFSLKHSLYEQDQIDQPDNQKRYRTVLYLYERIEP